MRGENALASGILECLAQTVLARPMSGACVNMSVFAQCILPYDPTIHAINQVYYFANKTL